MNNCNSKNDSLNTDEGVKKMDETVKLFEDRAKVFSYMESLAKELPKYRFGLAGSIARGTQKKNSDIDIVVDTDSIPIEDIEFIKNYFSLGRDVDVLILGLLKKEDEELDSFALSMGLPINNESVYKTIVRDVIWIN